MIRSTVDPIELAINQAIQTREYKSEISINKKDLKKQSLTFKLSKKCNN